MHAACWVLLPLLCDIFTLSCGQVNPRSVTEVNCQKKCYSKIPKCICLENDMLRLLKDFPRPLSHSVACGHSREQAALEFEHFLAVTLGQLNVCTFITKQKQRKTSEHTVAALKSSLI